MLSSAVSSLFSKMNQSAQNHLASLSNNWITNNDIFEIKKVEFLWMI